MATHRSIPAWSIPQTGAWRAAVPGVAESRTGPSAGGGGEAGRNPAPPRNPGQQRGHSSACLPPACHQSVCGGHLAGNAAAWAGVKEPSAGLWAARRARARRGQGAGSVLGWRTSGPARLCVRACLEASTAAVQDIARLLWERAERRHGGFNSCLAPGQALHSEIFRS